MRTALALVLPLLLAAQSALLEIHLIGEGAVYTAGSRTPGLTVEVRDELGRPAAGVLLSVRLPFEEAGGAFANGLNTEVVTTGADGRATTSPIRWSRTPGRVEVRIMAIKGGLRAGTLAALNLSGTAAAATAQARPAPAHARRLGSKWVIIALAVAVAAAGAGFASGRAAGNAATPAATPSASVQIGAPTITIGNP